MKRKVFCVLAAICLILTGCGQASPAQDPSSSSGEPTEDTTASIFGYEWVRPSVEGVNFDDFYTVPAYTDTPIIQPDPDRKVYISLSNQDCDYYPGVLSSASIQIVTTEQISKKDINVQISMETAYTLSIDDKTEHCHELHCNGGVANMSLTEEQYLMLQGIDWQNYGQQRSDAVSWYGTLVEDYNDPLYGKYQAALSQPFEDRQEAYEAAYKASSVEEIPMFYAFSVFVTFQDLCDEVVNTVVVDVAGESYTIDIGEWRFHAQTPEGVSRLLLTGSGIRKSSDYTTIDGIDTFYNHAYTGGYVRLSDAIEFTAQQDITLTAMTGENTSVEVLGGKIQYLNSDDSAAMDFYWDGKQKLHISAGTHVSITVFLYDERFAEYEVNCTMLLKVLYEVDGEEQTMTKFCDLFRINNLWETYLLALHGYDIGAYYTCYYSLEHNFVFESMPEAWKR